MATNRSVLVVLEEDPEWFDSRRFVTNRPEYFESVNEWKVVDLKTNKTILSDLSGEDAGLYADALEIKYNAYHDHDAVRRAAAERQARALEEQ